MVTVPTKRGSGIGLRLSESLDLPKDTFNLLFAALLITAFGVYAAGNAIFMDLAVAKTSSLIAVICVMQILVFYTFSSLLSNVVLGLLGTYLLTLIATYCRHSWAAGITYVLGAMALTYTVTHLRVVRKDLLPVLLMAVIATITILGCVDAYTSFDMAHRLNAGTVNKDTLFNASIAAMIKNYGVVSTGLHGLVSTPYHVLSHVLFAGISVLSGESVINVYGAAPWILFAPVLIFTVTTCGASIDGGGRLRVPVVWSFVCVLLAVAPLLFRRWGIWNSYFLSESYLVSLGLLMLALPLLFKRQMNIVDLATALMMSVFLTTAKATVGIVFVCLWLCRLVFFHRKVVSRETVAFLLSTVSVAISCISSASANSGNTAVSPFHFIRQYCFLGEHLSTVVDAIAKGVAPSSHSLLLALGALLGFFAIHFILTWILVGHAFFTKGDGVALHDVPYAVYSLAAAATGAVFVSAFYFAGGSGYYFSSVAFFVSLPGVAVILSNACDPQKTRTTILLAIIFAAVCIGKGRDIYKFSVSPVPKSDPAQESFVEVLIALKQNTAPTTVVMKNTALQDFNPVTDCTARPFMYPAVSERAWVGVIDSNSCTYEHYGYSQYGVTGTHKPISIPPVLPAGTQLLNLQGS